MGNRSQKRTASKNAEPPKIKNTLLNRLKAYRGDIKKGHPILRIFYVITFPVLLIAGYPTYFLFNFFWRCSSDIHKVIHGHR